MDDTQQQSDNSQQDDMSTNEQPEAPQTQEEAQPQEPQEQGVAQQEQPQEQAPQQTGYPSLYNQPVQQQELPQQPKLSDLPQNEDGTVSEEAFNDWWGQQQQNLTQVSQAKAQEAARQEFMALRQEEQQWQAAERQFPEIAEDSDLKQFIHNQRIADLYNGGDGDVSKAAQAVVNRLRGAKEAGNSQAKETVKIQQSAHLETSSVKSDSDSSRRAQLMEQTTSRNKATADRAREALLKDMIEKGQI